MPKSFLENYLTFATNNETQPIAHLWAGLGVLSATIGRKVRLVNGPFIFYPNMYIMLVGDAGCGKSTALNPAKRLLRHLKVIPITAEAPTVQALTQWMSGGGLKEGLVSPCIKYFKRPTGEIEQYTQAAIMVGELVSFLNTDPHGWSIFLTNIFDEEYHHVQTKNKGEDIIVGPYVSILGCLTTDVSNQLQTASILSLGLGRRTIFVWVGDRGTPIARPVVEQKHLDAEKECIEWLNGLLPLQGEFDWSSSYEWYDRWYYKHRSMIHKISSPQTKGYYDSKNMQLFKTAMLVSLSEQRDLIITPDHFEQALDFLSRTEVNLPKVFSGSGRNEDAPVALAILERLEKLNEPVPINKMLQMFWADLKNGRPAFDAIIHQLTVTDRIIKWDEQIPEIKIGASVTYIATPEGYRAFKARRQTQAPVQQTAVTSTQPSPEHQPVRSSGFVVELGPPVERAEDRS